MVGIKWLRLWAAGSVAGAVGVRARWHDRLRDHNRCAGGRSGQLAGETPQVRGRLLAASGRMLCMWMFLSRRLRMWLLLSIAVPLVRILIHRLALAAERRDPSTRTARAFRQADSAVTAVSRRTSRRAAR